jgi:hypothetical protein
MHDENIQLPNELWFQIIETVENIADIWTMSQVSYSLRKIGSNVFAKKMLSADTQPKFYLHFSERCGSNAKVCLTPNGIANGNVKFSLCSQPGDVDGFRGFARLLVDLFRNILKDAASVTEQGQPVLFRRESFLQLQKFLKDGWESVTGTLPAHLRAAYSTLFNHIYRTYDGVCNRPTPQMSAEIQMSLIAQTWRVLDILSPNGPRDFKVCTAENCCSGLTQCKGTRSSPNIPDFSLMFPEFSLYESSEQFLTENELLFATDTGSFRVKTFAIPMKCQPNLTIVCLAYGENQENMTIIDVTMNIQVS